MCAILDNDVVHEVFGGGQVPAGRGFLDWIDKGQGRLIAGGKLLRELGRNKEFRSWWREAVLAGRAADLGPAAVDDEAARLTERGACRSNDQHVIALAILSGARLLYSNDRLLQRDFKNRRLIHPPGKVFSTLRGTTFTKHRRQLLATSRCA